MTALLSITQRQQVVLNLDAAQNRQWRVWANGILIQQSNSSNPRIQQLSPQKLALMPGFEEVALAYEVRIVKSEALKSLIRADVTWALSFDGGATQMMCRCVPPIREHNNPGLAWMVYLRK